MSTTRLCREHEGLKLSLEFQGSHWEHMDGGINVKRLLEVTPLYFTTKEHSEHNMNSS